jgi:hypothetical protein
MTPHACVTALLADRRLCLDCVAAHAATSIVETDEVLTAIARLTPRSLCQACEKIRMTYSIKTPSRRLGPVEATEPLYAQHYAVR